MKAGLLKKISWIWGLALCVTGPVSASSVDDEGADKANNSLVKVLSVRDCRKGGGHQQFAG